MVTAEQVRAALRAGWDPGPEACSPLHDTTWIVTGRGERYVAKLVPAACRGRFEAGLAAAERLAASGFAAGAPVRAADGALTVALPDGALGLLRWVPGRPLAATDPVDQQWWGDGLAAIHRGLVGFSHPGLSRLQPVRADAAYLDLEPWLRPAVAAAGAAFTKLCVTDQLTYGVLHGDPGADRFRIDVDTGRTGVLGWGRVASGPLAYDAAAAIWHAGGEASSPELMDGYLAAGPVSKEELQAALPTMLRLRWAVHAESLAARAAGRDGSTIRRRLAEARVGLEM